VRLRRVNRTQITTAVLATVAFAYAAADTGRAQAMLFGFGGGAFIAAIALAVVVTYQGSGMVNLASGAIAMYGAYTFNDLRRSGTLLVPPLPNPLAPIEGIAHRLGADGFAAPHWPVTIGFGRPVGVGAALAVTALVMVMLGLVLHVLVLRPLRTAPVVTKVVASLGVMIALQAIIILRKGTAQVAVQPVFDKRSVAIGSSLRVPADQLEVAAVTVAVAVLLWAVYRFTRLGLATRAAASNERGAVLLGYNPDLLSAASWVLSCVVAGLFGVLVTGVNGSLDSATLPFLVVPALGAALLAGFTSFGVCVAAGFAIGIGQSLIQYAQSYSWFPKAGSGPIPGVVQSVPFLVIILALVLRGKALPTRAAVAEHLLPRVPRPRVVSAPGLSLAAAAAAGLLVLGPDWRLSITNSVIGVVICLSVVVVTGYVGQISLAPMVLAGVAGFTLSKLTLSWGVPFPLGPIVSALAASAFGVLLALPALRVRGVQLAVVTLAAGVAVENLVFRNPSWSSGASGAPVGPPRLLGMKLGPNDPGSVSRIGYTGDGKLPSPWFGVLCLVVTVALGALVVNLRRSGTGKRLLAVRSNERAAAAVGINVAGAKLNAFAISAFVAGIGGALSGYRFGSVTPAAFGAIASLLFFAFAYLGGITSLWGAVIGGLLVPQGVIALVLSSWLGISQEYTALIGAVGLVVTAIRSPSGIDGAIAAASNRLRQIRRSNERSLNTVIARGEEVPAHA
jgi:branched-chain amino acid transport system permease protein